MYFLVVSMQKHVKGALFTSLRGLNRVSPYEAAVSEVVHELELLGEIMEA